MDETRKQAVALRHLAFEDLGTFAGVLERAGYAVRVLDAGVDDLDPAESADLLIVLGGPISVNDGADYPWLAAETALVGRRLAAGRPTLGICLGAQMMAQVLGAAVRPGNAGKEIGFGPLTLTAEGRRSPLRHLDPSVCQPLHWHGETFDLPPGAVPLASTDAYPNQAFALGRHGLGLQFHPEADVRRLEQWLIGHAGELAAAGISPATLRAQAAAHGMALATGGAAMLAEWLAGLPNKM